MGRPKLFDEQLRVPLPLGSIARIDATLEVGEPRLDLIREAIDKEVLRRMTLKAKQRQAIKRLSSADQ